MKKRELVIRELARDRIIILFNMALERARSGDIELARRYVKIALRIASKAKLKLPKVYKRGYCRKCYVPLIPGSTLSVRIKSEGRGSRVVYRCTLCGWIRRFMVKTSKTRSKKEFLEK